MKLNDLASSPNAPLCHEAQIKAETKLNDIQKAELVASLMAFSRGDQSLRRQSNLDGLQGIGGGGLFDDMHEPDETMFEFPEDKNVPTEDLFALTMGDFMISGSNLEGASPTTTVNEMTRRLEQVHKTPKDQLFVPELHAAQPEIGELQHNFEEMKQITNVQENFARKQSCFLPLEPEESPQVLALKVAEKVRQLKPGQFVLIPGGWAGGALNGINGSGHFIGYAINKQKDGKGFEFIPVNTGYGISAYHGFIQNAAGNKDLYATDISLRNIPEDLICGHKDKSAGFLTGLMEISMGRLEIVEDHFTKKTRTIDDAVKTIYELMWKLTGQTTTLSNKEKEYQTPQRAGTCTWKPLKTMVKLKLGSVTSRRLILETDMQSLQYHLNYWKNNLAKEPTKRVLLIEINKKMARRTVKLLEDNIISFATAEKVYQQIQKNHQILKPYYQDLNIEPNELKTQADAQFNQVLQPWNSIHNAKDIEQTPTPNKELALQPVVLKKCDTLAHIHYNLKALNQALEHILPNATQHPQKAEALLRQIQYFFNALPSSNFDAVFKDITVVKPREMNLAFLGLYENFLILNSTIPHPAGSKAVVSAQLLMYMHKLGIHDDRSLKHTSIPAIKRIIDIALHTPTYVPDAQELKTLYNLRQEAVRLTSSKPVPLASQISMEQGIYINVSLEPKEALAALAQPAEVAFYETLLKENPQLKYQCRAAHSMFLNQSEAVQHMADLILLIQNDEKPSAAGLMPENLTSLNAIKRAIRLACLTSTHDVDLQQINKNQGQLLSDAQMQLSGMPMQQVRYIIGNKPISTHFYKKNFSTTAYQFEDKNLEHISMGADKAYSEHNEFENLFEEYNPNRKQKNENELQIQHPNKQNVNQYLHLSRVYKEDALTHAMVVNFYLENMTLLSNPDHQHTLELALLRSKPDQNKPSQGYLESQITLNGHSFANRTVELLHSAALYFNDKNDTKTLLFISKLSQLTAAHFKANGISFSLDQSTTAILKRIKKDASASEQAMINALTAIQLQYEKTSTSNLSSMIRYGFHSVFYKENGSIQHNQVESQLFKMLFKMQPYFQQLLKSDQMDKTLAQTLQSLKLPATGKEKVSGTWPLIKFGEYTFDFNRFTVIRKGLDLHLQIPSTLLNLPDFKQLMLNKSMDFEVKDQVYTFKKHHLSFDLSGKDPVIKKTFKLGQDNLNFRLINPSEKFKEDFPFIGNDYHLWRHEQRLIATHKETGQLIQLTTKNGNTRITSGQSTLQDLGRVPAFMTHIEEPDNIRAWYKDQQLQKIDLPHFGESFSLKDGDPSRLRWDKDIRYVLNSKPSPLFGHFRQYIELVNAENHQDRIVLFPQGKPLSVRNRNDSGREPSEVIIEPYTSNPNFYTDGTQNYTNSKSMYAIKMSPRGQLLAQTPEEHLAAASIAYRLHHYKDAMQHVNKAISDQPFSLESQNLIAEMFRPISTGLDLNASTSTLGMSNNHPNAFAFRLQLVAALAQNGVNKPDTEMAHILRHYSLKTKIELARYVETINNVDAGLRLTTPQLKAFQALDDNPAFDGVKIVTGKAERFINQVAGNGKIESAHKELKQKESDKIIKDKDTNKVQVVDYGMYAFPETLPKPKKGTIDLLSNRKLMSKNEWFTTLRSLSVLSPNENELQKLASALVWLVKDFNTDDKQEIADRMKFYSFAFDDDINFHKLYLTTAISAMATDAKTLEKICPADLRDELNGLQPAPKISMTKTFADALTALNGINEPNLFGLPQKEASDFDAMSLSVKSLDDGDTLMTDAPATSGSFGAAQDMKSALYHEKLSDKNKALHDFFYHHYEQKLKLDDIKLVTPPENNQILYKSNKAKATELLKPIQFGPVLLSNYLNASFDPSMFKTGFNPLKTLASKSIIQDTYRLAAQNPSEVPSSESNTIQEQMNILRSALRRPQEHTEYKLRTNIQQIKAALQQEKVSSKQLEDMKATILQQVNAGRDPQSHVKHQLDLTGRRSNEITMPQIKARLAQHWLNQLTQQNPHITQAQLGEVGLKTISMLSAQIKNQTIDRALDLIQQIENLAGKQDALSQMHVLEQSFMSLISTERAYNPLENPEYLIFEAEAGILLRKDQVTNIDILNERTISNDHAVVDDVITQLPMGSGKTKVLLPLLALKNANGNNLSTITVLQPLMAINAAEVNESTVNAFEQYSHTFEFNRKTKISKDTLTALQTQINTIIENREYIVTAPESIQCFSLRYIELLKMRHESTDEKAQKELDEQLELMGGILRIFKRDGINLIDEADTVLNPLYEVNYSIGQEKNLDAEHIQLMTDLYKIMITTPDIEKKLQLRANNQAQTPRADIDKIIHLLASKALTLPQFKGLIDPKYHQELTQYLTSVSFTQNRIPKALANSRDPAKRKAAELIEMLRLQMTQILPITLSQSGGVSYGIDAAKQVYQSFPHNHGQAQPQSRFGHVLMTGHYTLQNYLHKAFGIPESLVQSTLETISSQILSSARLNKVNPNKTAQFKKLAKLLNSVHLKIDSLADIKPQLPSFIQQVTKALNADPLAVLDFTQANVMKTIGYYPQRISSNSQDIVSLFAHTHGFSGTMTHSDTYHTDLDRQLSAKTYQEVYSILTNPKITQIMKSVANTPETMMKTIASTPDANKVSAIIDTGALFKNLKPAEVAEGLAQHVQKTNKKAITYFDKKNNLLLKDLIHKQDIILPDTSKATFETTGFSADERLDLYDQAHAIGVDIPRQADAIAYLTLGENTTFSDLAQGILRMRQLQQGQQVRILVPEETANLILKNAALANVKDDWVAQKAMTPKALLWHTFSNQGTDLEREKVLTIQHKVKNNFTTLITEAATHSSKQVRQDLYGFFESILIEQLQQLQQEFKMSSQVKLETALNDYFNDMRLMLQNLMTKNTLKGESKKVIEQVLQKAMMSISKDAQREMIEPLGALPETITSRLNARLDSQVQIQTEEQLAETKMELKTATQQQEKTNNDEKPADIKKWPFSDKNSIFNFDFNVDINVDEKMPQLQRLTDIDQVKGLFSDNLLISENLVTTLMSEKTSLFSDKSINQFQKPTDYLLMITDRKTKKTRGLALSLSDTTAMKNALNAKSSSKDKYDIVLLDKLGNIEHKGNTQFQDSDIDQNDAMQKLIMQIKVLNAPVLHRLELNFRENKQLDLWLKEGTPSIQQAKALIVKSFLI